MKKSILISIFVFCALAVSAQDKPKPCDDLCVAKKDLQIAQLTAQVRELNSQVQLYSAALGLSAQRQADQQAVEAAQEAVQKATPKPEVRK